jgi:hypothetical protein
MDRTLIDEYERGAEKLRQALYNLTREDLLQVPSPEAGVGKWSIQQVVIHIMDSELVSADRLKRMIAEDNPTLIGYDETKFANNLRYEEQSAEDAVTVVELVRRNLARVLRLLPEAAFGRKGTHNERGAVTVGAYLKATVEHLEHHLKFINQKREKMGKSMW